MNMQKQSSGCIMWKRYSKKILQNSQENIFFDKVASLQSETLLKKNPA